MQNLDSINWIYPFIIYIIGTTAYNQSYTVLSKTTHNKTTAVILLQILSGFTSLAFIPIFSWALPTNIYVWGVLILASVFYALSDWLQMQSRSKLELSEFIPISQLPKVFLFIFSIIFFSEQPSTIKLIAIILVIIGNITMRIDNEKTITVNKYILMATLAMLLMAIAISIDIRISKQFNMAFYTSITMFVPALITSMSAHIKPKQLIQEFKVSKTRYALVSFLWVISYMFSVISYRAGRNISTQISLRGIIPIINFILAFIFLKERQNITKKIISINIISIGIILSTIN